VTVVDGAGTTVVAAQTTATFGVPVQPGRSYLVQRTAAPTTAMPFAAVTGSPAATPKSLNGRVIGLAR
jgi:hypothetical protein